MIRLMTFVLLLTAVLAPLPAAADRAAGPLKRGEALSQAAASMLADIGQATWIRDGQSQHIIYVYFDPNCPYCHRVYYNLRTAVDIGEVELRWIPVGILTATSHGKAAALLEAANPTEALHRNERLFSTETGSFGGITEEPVPRDDTVQRLDRNLALLRRSGRDAVPSLLYRDKAGKARFIVGAPPQEMLDRIVREAQ